MCDVYVRYQGPAQVRDRFRENCSWGSVRFNVASQDFWFYSAMHQSISGFSIMLVMDLK